MTLSTTLSRFTYSSGNQHTSQTKTQLKFLQLTDEITAPQHYFPDLENTIRCKQLLSVNQVKNELFRFSLDAINILCDTSA